MSAVYVDRVKSAENHIKLMESSLRVERAELRQAQSTIEDLKSELRHVQRKLDHYQLCEMRNVAEKQRVALEFYQTRYQETDDVSN
jgi:hypothetical protein